MLFNSSGDIAIDYEAVKKRSVAIATCTSVTTLPGLPTSVRVQWVVWAGRCDFPESFLVSFF